MKVYDHFGGQLPGNLSPSTPIRRWDTAFLVGVFSFAVVYMTLQFIVSRSLPILGDALPKPWYQNAWDGLQLLWSSEFRQSYVAWASAAPLRVWGRFGLCLGGGLTSFAWVFVRALRPLDQTRHVTGPQLMQGQDAERELKYLSTKKPWMKLHPGLGLGKKSFTRGWLIYGSAGSGKTQILHGLLSQIFARNQRLFLYDRKRDFSGQYPGYIISPWDARSLFWDIARDCRSPADAMVLVNAFIPKGTGSTDDFWVGAGKQLLLACVIALQNERGLTWGWGDLASKLAQEQGPFVELLKAHFPSAVALIADEKSTATTSVLASLAQQTRHIQTLARAWGNPIEGSKNRFSIRAWCGDYYRGPHQIIVQGGPDSELQAAYISAMVNLGIAEIGNLPDNEMGRTLWFVFDEAATAGKVDINTLAAVYRSKGCCTVIGVQDMSQVKETWGDNQAQALSSLVGGHIVCQMSMGETRERVADLFGKRRVAITTANSSGQGANRTTTTSVHEEQRALVQPSDLTSELGPIQSKRMKHGFGIRAIVNGIGKNALMLDFPGMKVGNIRPNFVPASWTIGPANPMHRGGGERRVVGAKPEFEAVADTLKKAEAQSIVERQPTADEEEKSPKSTLLSATRYELPVVEVEADPLAMQAVALTHPVAEMAVHALELSEALRAPKTQHVEHDIVMSPAR